MRPIFADTAPVARTRSKRMGRIEILLWVLIVGALTFAGATITLQLI